MTFDLQKSITSNIPSFLTTGKYPGEFHIPGYNFAGPGTHLDKRLDSNDNPKSDSIPINGIDSAAYKHDIAYRDADKYFSENPKVSLLHKH